MCTGQRQSPALSDRPASDRPDSRRGCQRTAISTSIPPRCMIKIYELPPYNMYKTRSKAKWDWANNKTLHIFHPYSLVPVYIELVISLSVHACATGMLKLSVIIQSSHQLVFQGGLNDFNTINSMFWLQFWVSTWLVDCFKNQNTNFTIFAPL